LAPLHFRHSAGLFQRNQIMINFVKPKPPDIFPFGDCTDIDIIVTQNITKIDSFLVEVRKLIFISWILLIFIKTKICHVFQAPLVPFPECCYFVLVTGAKIHGRKLHSVTELSYWPSLSLLNITIFQTSNKSQSIFLHDQQILLIYFYSSRWLKGDKYLFITKNKKQDLIYIIHYIYIYLECFWIRKYYLHLNKKTGIGAKHFEF